MYTISNIIVVVELSSFKNEIAILVGWPESIVAGKYMAELMAPMFKE